MAAAIEAGTGATVGEQLQQDGVRHAAINDDSLVDALINCVGHAADLGDHAARDDAGGLVALDLGDLHLGDEGGLILLVPQQACDVGHGDELLGLEGDGDLGSSRVGVDVVGLLMDDLGQAYNVNADTAAAQIAIALKAEKLVSMTDIAGLLRDKEDETTLIPEVEVTEIEGYKSAGIIAGGMIPKIGGMADAIYQGVHEAVIIDGRVPHSILLELFSNRGSGTRFYRRSHRE